MKKILVIGVFLLLALFCVLPAYAMPTAFTLNYNQAQFQWRAFSGVPLGNWSYTYLADTESSDYVVTGNVLHTTVSYSPVVSDLQGQSTVYTFDKDSGLWIEHEGTVSYSYEPYYGSYTATNYWRGYVQFDGTPSKTSFFHGVGYQWVYIFAPQSDTGVTTLLPNAVWDNTVGAWLVGFSIYLWDPAPQSYAIPFPNPFIEPVPASNYNPLDL